VIGSAGNDIIIGNTAANSISGGAGADTLQGGAGADTLTGGAGADTFVLLESVEDVAAVIGVFRDIITDFQVGSDQLEFDVVSLARLVVDGFSELGLTGMAGEQGDNFLVVGNGAVADQDYAQMLYDMTTGVLSIDADGTGAEAAVFIGTIGAGLSLTAADFLFVVPVDPGA
jgi:Ca2+-binding RTX toxin-like protein